MLRSARGTTERPGRNVRATAGLDRRIAAAGWSTLIRRTTHKAEASAGCEVVLVDARHRPATFDPGRRRGPSGRSVVGRGPMTAPCRAGSAERSNTNSNSRQADPITAVAEHGEHHVLDAEGPPDLHGRTAVGGGGLGGECLRTSCTSGTIRRMRTSAARKFEFGHQFKAREARDQLKDVLDEAERGGVAVVRREKPVVLVLRDDVDQLVASKAPLDVESAVTDGQFAFWLEDVPVHAVGADLDDAEEQFLDALVDYADLWYQELRYAPNHARNQCLALRVAMYAGDREELRRVVFGDD